MPVPTHEVAWWGSLLWLVGVAGVAFVVAWLTGTRLHIRRGVYVPILFTVTAALAIGYVEWLGVGFTDVLTNNWGWGVRGAVVSALLRWKPLTHQPVDRHVEGRQLRWELFWEGGVYGTAEGVLLSALPPFIAWQMVHSLGWTGTGGGIARWTFAILAGAAVVVIHHLGYWNCRNKILIPITLALSVLTVGFLVTGSWIAPALGHVFMHFEATIHGVEMPPVDRPAVEAPAAPAAPAPPKERTLAGVG
jgi:hypothetical protein